MLPFIFINSFFTFFLKLPLWQPHIVTLRDPKAKNDIFLSRSSLWKLKDIPDGGFTLQGQEVSVAKCLGNGFLHRACISSWPSGLLGCLECQDLQVYLTRNARKGLPRVRQWKSAPQPAWQGCRTEFVAGVRIRDKGSINYSFVSPVSSCSSFLEEGQLLCNSFAQW